MHLIAINKKILCARIHTSHPCDVPRCVAGVSQGNVTSPEVIVEPQNRQARIEGVTTFNTNHGRYFAAPPSGLDVPRGGDQLQVVRISLNESPDHIDLSQRQL